MLGRAAGSRPLVPVRPDVLLAARSLLRGVAPVGGFFSRSGDKLPANQEAPPLCERAARVRPGKGQARLDSGGRDPLGWRGQRGARHRAVRHPRIRLPRSASARVARALHDVLGSADARSVRGGRPPGVRHQVPHLARATDAGSGRGPRRHIHAQRVGWRMHRREPAVSAQGLPPRRSPACRCRRLFRARAAGSLAAHGLDVRPARSDQS